jgi:hypothetical protein
MLGGYRAARLGFEVGCERLVARGSELLLIASGNLPLTLALDTVTMVTGLWALCPAGTVAIAVSAIAGVAAVIAAVSATSAVVTAMVSAIATIIGATIAAVAAIIAMAAAVLAVLAVVAMAAVAAVAVMIVEAASTVGPLIRRHF